MLRVFKTVLHRGRYIAQLVKCLTEKPGAILMQVRVAGVARDFSPSADFLVLFVVQPPCAIACN